MGVAFVAFSSATHAPLSPVHDPQLFAHPGDFMHSGLIFVTAYELLLYQPDAVSVNLLSR
jgi:hypothetical protein